MFSRVYFFNFSFVTAVSLIRVNVSMQHRDERKTKRRKKKESSKSEKVLYLFGIFIVSKYQIVILVFIKMTLMEAALFDVIRMVGIPSFALKRSGAFSLGAVVNVTQS